jgi:hypothetical protein
MTNKQYEMLSLHHDLAKMELERIRAERNNPSLVGDERPSDEELQQATAHFRALAARMFAVQTGQIKLESDSPKY